MTPIRDALRARRLHHLVRREGVSPGDADALLDLLDALVDADPPFHAAMSGELDARMGRAEAGEASRARMARGDADTPSVAPAIAAIALLVPASATAGRA